MLLIMRVPKFPEYDIFAIISTAGQEGHNIQQKTSLKFLSQSDNLKNLAYVIK